MKRTMILLLAVAVVVVSAAPVGAKKPDNPGKGPTNPPACEVAQAFVTDPPGPFSPEGAREYTTYFIKLAPADLAERDGQDLCVEVTVDYGSLSDMNVALIDYPDPAARRCGFYWPGGKINEGDVFKVEFSLDETADGLDAGELGFCGSDPDLDWYDGLVVVVQPQLHAKTDAATLEVRIGFAEVAP